MIDEKRLDEIRANAQPLAPGKGYYGLPLLKGPVWTWEVPAYFFVGGTAGAAAVIALAAQVTRADRKLVRDARRVAAIGGALSAPLLISDLGRPERFLYMLRVFKPQSAMSVGSWTVAFFGGASAAAALFGERLVGNVAAVFAAASGLVMSTYTGVLIGATSVPVWAKHSNVLPIHFAASAAGSAASTLQLLGHDERALQLIGSAAAAYESYMLFKVRREKATNLMRAAEVLSGPVPLLLRLAGGRSKRARALAALSAITGSLLTRMAWIEAGRASVREP